MRETTMQFARSWCARAGLLAALALGVAAPALAQDCGGQPLRIVVGLSAGGGIDALGRMLAQRYTERTRQTAIVDNRAGAGGNIAAAYVAKAPADGCTVLLTGSNHVINPMIYAKAGYELKEFAPVTLAVEGASVLTVHPSQPFQTLQQLVAYAKANPGKLSYSSSGVGFPNHVAMELFLRAAKINIVHVPYKGSAPALSDAVAGVVPVSVSSAAAALGHIKSGRLRPLAVSVAKRWPTLPNVPTMAEAGYREATTSTWLGTFVPAGTPEAARTKLNQEFAAILHEPAIREKLAAQAYEPVASSVPEFDRFLHEEERVMRKLVQDLNLRIE